MQYGCGHAVDAELASILTTFALAPDDRCPACVAAAVKAAQAVKSVKAAEASRPAAPVRRRACGHDAGPEAPDAALDDACDVCRERTTAADYADDEGRWGVRAGYADSDVFNVFNVPPRTRR